MYQVNEIFYSLQGEGRWAGQAAIFVRMSGCNLKCPFCDTEFQEYTEMSAVEIAEKCDELSEPCNFIVFTGGEPSLQVDRELIDELHADGYDLAIETNGTHEIPERMDWVTCSPKVDFAPGAEIKVKKVDELKLIFDGEHEVNTHGINAKHYYLQPCDVGDEEKNRIILNKCIEYIKENPMWTLSIQIHKVVGIR